MKKQLLLLVLNAYALFTYAQAPIPNAGFENWAGGNPVGWGSSDQIVQQIFQPDPGGVERDTVAANVFSGNSSVRITSKEISIPGFGTQTIPGVLSLGAIGLDLGTFTPTITGYGYTDRPDSISFAAKFASGPGGTDTGSVAVTLTRWNGIETQIIANGFFAIPNSAGFQTFTFKLPYFSYLNPDTLYIQGISSSSQDAVLESSLWLDELAFSGLDTTFKAYITPFQDQITCISEVVEFSTDNIQGNTYQWYKDGVALNNETNATYTATTDGNYFVEVNRGGTLYYSDTINVTFVPLPTVTFTPDANEDTVCSSTAPFIPGGVSPFGGEFSGDAVDQDGFFNPAQANTGANAVTYTYTDDNGCTNEATANIFVKVCTGIEEIAEGINVNIFPNPANNVLQVQSNNLPAGAVVELYDLQGRLQSTTKVQGTVTRIPVTGLVTGQYMVKISDAQKTLVKASLQIAR